ncbi:hypothetical protein HA397_30325, partial [Escherichia coli]|nr:hypothetical protein [Escherichia coli]
VLIWWMLLTALWALAETPDDDWLWLRFPLGLYAGWLTAASWVSVGLIGAGWGIGPGETGWALFALSGAFATGAYIVSTLPAVGYAAALIWALVAVVVANLPGAPLVAAVAGLAAGGIVFLALRHAQQAQPPERG